MTNPFKNSDVSVNDECLLKEFDLTALTMTKKSCVIILNKIIVTRRGHGCGSFFMTQLTELADKKDWKLALTPDKSFGATSVSRLKRFYRQFGFRDNKGRNADFTISESMIRQPQSKTV